MNYLRGELAGGIPKNALPGLYQAADNASLQGQRSYKRGSAARLVSALLAAVSASMVWKLGELDVFAAGTAFFFLVALAAEVWLLAQRPADDWYDGRALAESAKTLAWRYAVSGVPYRRATESVDERLINDLNDLLLDAAATSIDPTSSPPISELMRSLRKKSLIARREVYLRLRIDAQRDWYRSRFAYNDARAKVWRLVLICTEVLGVVAAASRMIGFVGFDLPGIIASIVGAGSAWLAIQQHDSLARAYGLAGEELNAIREALAKISNEHDWAEQVADAEEAISREHTMWRASRCNPVLVRRLDRKP